MQRTKIGVIGLGNMGRHHVRHFSNIESARLEWVCDANSERAQHYATAHDCKAYTSLDEALAHPVDAVTIAAPTSLHFTLGTKVLSRGIHLLLEKPLCETLEEGHALLALAAQKNLVLSVGHIERFNPVIVALKALIDEGKLGRIVSLSSQRMSTFPPQIKDANVVLDLAVHDLDIFSYLTGQRPIRITGKSCKSLIQDRADSSDIFVEYPDAAGHVQVNWICPIKVRTLRVLGTLGLAQVDYMTSTLHFTPSVYTHQKDHAGCETAIFSPTDTQVISTATHDALHLELREFIAAVQGRPSSIVSGKAGLEALEDALCALA